MVIRDITKHMGYNPIRKFRAPWELTQSPLVTRCSQQNSFLKSPLNCVHSDSSRKDWEPWECDPFRFTQSSPHLPFLAGSQGCIVYVKRATGLEFNKVRA